VVFMIYLLIELEAVFIFSSYWDELGIVSFIPALVYLVMALTDVNMLNKKLSILVLITSIGIAVPRIFLMVGERYDNTADKVFRENVQSYDRNKYEANKQDCLTLYPIWRVDDRRRCNEDNKSELEKARIHNEPLKNKIEDDKKRNPLTLQDLAIIILFATISITLPSAIILILFGRYEKRDKEVIVKKEMENHKPDPKEEAIRMYREGTYTIKEIVDATGISKSTLYRVLENEK